MDERKFWLLQSDSVFIILKLNRLTPIDESIKFVHLSSMVLVEPLSDALFEMGTGMKTQPPVEGRVF